MAVVRVFAHFLPLCYKEVIDVNGLIVSPQLKSVPFVSARGLLQRCSQNSQCGQPRCHSQLAFFCFPFTFSAFPASFT
jgi:hypothetical protein